jgi:hypothetical protein
MKTRLLYISPVGLANFLAAASFVVSIPAVLVAFATIGPGRTVHLKGYFGLSFTNSLDLSVVLAWPLINAIAAYLTGLIGAWVYNVYVTYFGGISVKLGSDEQL